MPVVAIEIKQSREHSLQKVFIRDKLKMPKMAISAEVSSRNRFSVLVIAVIYPSVLEKEQTPRKIKVSPITITKQQHETILAILGELKIGKFSIKIIII